MMQAGPVEKVTKPKDKNFAFILFKVKYPSIRTFSNKINSASGVSGLRVESNGRIRAI